MTDRTAKMLNELKRWESIRDSKRMVNRYLIRIAALENERKGRVSWRLRNIIAENLAVQRDAEFRVREIRRLLGVR